MKMIRQKKAILMPEVLKLLLAVVSIFLLIYLAYSLYQIFLAKHKLEQAKPQLREIMSKIAGLKDNGGMVEHALYSPENWALTGWPYNPLLSGELKPEECKKNGWENCLCLCKIDYYSSATGLLTGCNDFGICEEIKHKELHVNPGIITENYPIFVNDLLSKKKSLIIGLDKTKDILTIKPQK